MDTLAIQATMIVGVTGLMGKFIKDPEERDVLLPVIAAIMGVLTQMGLYGQWTWAAALQGLVTGGAVTGLYAVVTGDGRKSGEIPVRAVSH